MKQYYSAGDPNDVLNFTAYSWANTLGQVLEQCGDDLTRGNLMFQASHLKNFHAPGLLPGITLNTSPTNYRIPARPTTGPSSSLSCIDLMASSGCRSVRSLRSARHNEAQRTRLATDEFCPISRIGLAEDNVLRLHS